MSAEAKNFIDLGDSTSIGYIRLEGYTQWQKLREQQDELVRSIVLELVPQLLAQENALTAQLKGKPTIPEKFAIYKARRAVRNKLARIVSQVRKELSDGLNSYIQWGD